MHKITIFLSFFLFYQISAMRNISYIFTFHHFFYFVIIKTSSPNIYIYMTIRCILYFTKYGTLLTIIHNYIELSYFSFRHLQPWFRMILVQTVISMQRPSSLAKKKKNVVPPSWIARTLRFLFRTVRDPYEIIATIFQSSKNISSKVVKKKRRGISLETLRLPILIPCKSP